MSNEMAYEMEEFLEGLGSVVAANTLSSLFGIVLYVLSAVALYSLAKRRGIRNAWLSWIPVGRVWILGSLADQYRYVAKGEVRNKRKALLTLSLIQMVIVLIVVGITIGSVVNIVAAAVHSYSDEQIFEAVFGPLMGLVFLCLPAAGIAIAQLIIRFMALYDVYCSCSPDNAVMFLVLSIFFKFTEPFFLFFNRLKDDGMKKQQAAYQPPAFTNSPQNGGTWQAPQNPNGNEPAQNPQSYQNPQGSAEPWTKTPENQDPWNQGPEQL